MIPIPSQRVSAARAANRVASEACPASVVCTKLRQVVEQTGIGLVLVSHLKRPEGRGHEEV